MVVMGGVGVQNDPYNCIISMYYCWMVVPVTHIRSKTKTKTKNSFYVSEKGELSFEHVKLSCPLRI